jgi:hypothetical protein
MCWIGFEEWNGQGHTADGVRRESPRSDEGWEGAAADGAAEMSARLLVCSTRRSAPCGTVEELDHHQAEYRVANGFAGFDSGLMLVPYIPNANGKALLLTGPDNHRYALEGSYFSF